MVTSFERPRRPNFLYRGHDGLKTWIKSEDSTESLTIDWADRLGADTISDSDWEGDGVTLSGESNTTTSTTVMVAGSGGYVTNTVTTTGGETLKQMIRVRAKAGDALRSDYR